MNQGENFLKHELRRIFKPYGIRMSNISRAFKTATAEQDKFTEDDKGEGA